MTGNEHHSSLRC